MSARQCRPSMLARVWPRSIKLSHPLLYHGDTVSPTPPRSSDQNQVRNEGVVFGRKGGLVINVTFHENRLGNARIDICHLPLILEHCKLFRKRLMDRQILRSIKSSDQLLWTRCKKCKLLRNKHHIMICQWQQIKRKKRQVGENTVKCGQAYQGQTGRQTDKQTASSSMTERSERQQDDELQCIMANQLRDVLQF